MFHLLPATATTLVYNAHTINSSNNFFVVTTEDTLLRDVSDLMEEIQEESNLWNSNNDSSHSINKHVTLLLFRDGDHLNLLRVIDRGDVASPISGAMRYSLSHFCAQLINEYENDK